MNFNQEYILNDTFAQENGYFSNAETVKHTHNFVQFQFESSDPFNKTKSKLNSSPLKTPLEGAINKVLNTRGRDSSTSRINSEYPNHISAITQRYCRENDDQQILDKLHPQALQFLQKYFSGCSTISIQISDFIDRLMEQFNNLWNDPQARAVLPQFIKKLTLKLGNDTVQLWRLEQLVRQNGIIGLILSIFKQLKSQQQTSQISRTQSDYVSYKYGQSQWDSSICSPPQITNLKNIIQQFTEGLAKSIQNEIYLKLNGQMRKLVLKYNQAQNLLKIVNDRINQNIDKINYGAKKNELERNYQNAVGKLNDRVKELQNQIEKQRISKIGIQNQNTKLIVENQRLNDMIQKLQNHIIKTQQNDNLKQKSNFITIPERNNITNENSRIITSFGPPIQTYSKIVPLSPLRQQVHPNMTTVSRFRGAQKQNNTLLNTATLVRGVTPTKQRIVPPQVSPSRMIRR